MIRELGAHVWQSTLFAVAAGLLTIAFQLAEALSREGQAPGEPAATNTYAGLPGRHASFETYPTGEFQALSVPLDSLSGRVDIAGQIKALLETGATGRIVASVRDAVPASAGIYQAKFILIAGSYVCSLVVKEQDTGRLYGETIQFEVK